MSHIASNRNSVHGKFDRLTITGRDSTGTPQADFLLQFVDTSGALKIINPNTLSIVGSALKLEDADLDTKVEVEQSADEDKIRFSTAGTERMLIDTNGDVSVGTTFLHVDTTNARVGINTNSPDQALEVNGVIRFESSGQQVDLSTPAGETGIIFDVDENNNRSRFNIGNYDTVTVGDRSVQFFYNDDGASSSLNIRKGGNVGIGIALPTVPLDVVGDINTTTDYNIGGTQVLSSTTLGSTVVNSSLTSVGTIGTGTWEGTAIATGFLTSGIASGDNVKTSALCVDDEYARFTATGLESRSFAEVASDIGPSITTLGTIVPDLVVSSDNASGTNTIQIQNTNAGATAHAKMHVCSGGGGAGDAYLHLDIAGTKEWSIGLDNSDSDKLKFDEGATPGSNTRMTLLTGGNVGIGTDAPTQLLEVNGGVIRFESSGQQIDLSTPAGETGIIFDVDQNNNRSRFNIANNDNVTAGDRFFNLYYNDDGAANGLTIRNGGDVGIGTNLPSQQLHVVGSAALFCNASSTNRGIQINPLSGASAGGGHLFFREVDSDDTFGASIGYNSAGASGIHNWANDTFNISVHNASADGVAQITIPRTGNVGINVSDPSTQLEVNGKVKIDNGNFSAPSNGIDGGDGQKYIAWPGSVSAVPYGLGIDSNQMWYSVPATAEHAWFTGTTERMVIESGGNVGIGTDNPGNTIHISDGTATGLGATPDGRGMTMTGVNGNCRIYLEENGGTADENVYMMESGGDAFKIHAMTSTGGGFSAQNAFVIKADGNVGIGTSAPDKLLHIFEGDSTATPITGAQVVIENNLSSALQFLGGGSGVQEIAFGDAGDNEAGVILYFHLNDEFQFHTSGTSQMVLNSSGNLGIGTSSPTAKLHIEDSSNVTSRIHGTGAATWARILTENDSGNYEIAVAGTAGDFSTDANDGDTVFSSSDRLLLQQGSGAAAITIDSSGNVGIRTDITTNFFTVKNGIHQRLACATNDNIYTSESTGCHIWQNDTSVIMDLDSSGNLTITGSYSPFTGTHIVDTGVTGNDGLIYSSDGVVSTKTVICAEIGVTLASTVNDKKVYGVGWEGDKIVSVGEGALWCCDENGEIENGDYVTSCGVTGYGQLQDDDILHNYTIAKLTEDSDFDDMSLGVTYCRYLDSNAVDVGISGSWVNKAKLCSCTFHCG